jgi:hypothetical protein
MLPVAVKLDNETLRSDARFSLRKQEDGTFSPSIHLIRYKPDLERPYFGIRFSEEDKNNLLTTGNLGRVADAEFQKGEKTPILLSLDKQTNELVTFRQAWMRTPETYKGVLLSDEQKQKLNNGEKISVEGMTSTKGTRFDGEVQFNADKRYCELIFNNDYKQSQKQAAAQSDVPKTFRSKALTEQQRDSLREQKTVFVDGLIDGRGKGYAGYVTLNKESGKLDFMFPKDYKEAVAAGKAIPDDRNKTQAAVTQEHAPNKKGAKQDKSRKSNKL